MYGKPIAASQVLSWLAVEVKVDGEDEIDTEHLLL